MDSIRPPEGTGVELEKKSVVASVLGTLPNPGILVTSVLGKDVLKHLVLQMLP